MLFYWAPLYLILDLKVKSFRNTNMCSRELDVMISPCVCTMEDYKTPIKKHHFWARKYLNEVFDVESEEIHAFSALIHAPGPLSFKSG